MFPSQLDNDITILNYVTQQNDYLQGKWQHEQTVPAAVIRQKNTMAFTNHLQQQNLVTDFYCPQNTAVSVYNALLFKDEFYCIASVDNRVDGFRQVTAVMMQADNTVFRRPNMVMSGSITQNLRTYAELPLITAAQRVEYPKSHPMTRRAIFLLALVPKGVSILPGDLAVIADRCFTVSSCYAGGQVFQELELYRKEEL